MVLALYRYQEILEVVLGWRFQLQNHLKQPKEIRNHHYHLRILLVYRQQTLIQELLLRLHHHRNL
jgi:hypothetical protein